MTSGKWNLRQQTRIPSSVITDIHLLRESYDRDSDGLILFEENSCNLSVSVFFFFFFWNFHHCVFKSYEIYLIYGTVKFLRRDMSTSQMSNSLTDIAGARLEPKRFAIVCKISISCIVRILRYCLQPAMTSFTITILIVSLMKYQNCTSCSQYVYTIYVDISE